MKFLPGVVMGLMALAANAHAETLFASGKLYGGSTQNSATCYIFNASRTPINVPRGYIFDPSGNDYTTGNTCPTNTPLPAGFGCAVTSTSIGSSSTSLYDCVFSVSTTAGLRGSFEIKDSNGVLQAQSLR